MIRVLHLVCFSELYGTQRSILSTIKCLDKKSFQVFLAAPASEDFEQLAAAVGAVFFPVPMTGLADFRSIAAIRKIIRSEKIDIVHCHLGISSFLGLVAARLCRIPAVVSRHFVRDRYVSIENKFLRALYLAIYKYMDRYFEKIICVSSAVRDAIVARESVSPQKCIVIHNGTDIEKNRAARAKSVHPHEKKIILCVSRLVPEKGLETLLQAFAICTREKTGGEYRLIIAGGGPLEKPLEELSAHLRISNSIHFAGFVPDIAPLLAEADVFVLPALEEPFGIALIEAMAAGLPSVATAAGGPLEIISHGVDGLLVPPGDASAMAAALCEILSDDSRAEAFSAAALRSAEKFDEQKIVLEFQKIYSQSIACGRPGVQK